MKYYTKYVPNEGPDNAKIILVGEAPGETENNEGRPFVGDSGMILMNCLNRNGIGREQVKLANLFHHRPFGNKLETVLEEPEFKNQVALLLDQIRKQKPNVIVAMGEYPLYYLTGLRSISKMRGSILPFVGDSSIKVVPTYHPAYVLRNRSEYPIFDQDIKKALAESQFSAFNYPERTYIINPQGLDKEEWVRKLCAEPILACDIETVKNSRHILCVGFAPSADLAVVFPANERQAIQRIFDAQNKLIFQFGTFDTIQLQLNGYRINDRAAQEYGRYYWWDTAIAQHVLNPELPRSLEFLTSVYTREPYYKKAGRGTIPDDAKGWSETFDKKALYEYNAKDCCCTFEVYECQLEQMTERFQPIFDFEMGLLEVTTHMSKAGLPVDNGRRLKIKSALEAQLLKEQIIINTVAGKEVNVRSTKLANYLFNDLKLPVRRTRAGKITTDEDAIVSLIAHCKTRISQLKTEDKIKEWKIKEAICKKILVIRGIRQLLSNYMSDNLIADDGRIYSTFKSQTETGRLAAQKFVDGSGVNAQTFPRAYVEVPNETGS